VSTVVAEKTRIFSTTTADAVRFLPFLITKNDKPDREKNHEYLANGSSDFNRTKKFGINAKNYTRKEPKINDSDQGQDTGIRQEYKTNKEDKRVQFFSKLYIILK
jgi:hypothetical protein